MALGIRTILIIYVAIYVTCEFHVVEKNIVGKMVLPAPISKMSFSHLPKYFGSNLPNLPKFNPNLPSPKYPIEGLIWG